MHRAIKPAGEGTLKGKVANLSGSYAWFFAPLVSRGISLVDTHGQSPWHLEIFQPCLTPFGRVLIEISAGYPLACWREESGQFPSDKERGICLN